MSISGPYPDRRSLILRPATVAMLLWFQPCSDFRIAVARLLKGRGWGHAGGLSHPLNPTAFVGNGVGMQHLKKAAICERQLNEAGRYRGNFMSIVDDVPTAHMQSPSFQRAEAVVEFARPRVSKSSAA